MSEQTYTPKTIYTITYSVRGLPARTLDKTGRVVAETVAAMIANGTKIISVDVAGPKAHRWAK